MQIEQEVGDDLTVCVLSILLKSALPTKFYGHKPCESGDLFLPTYHVTKREVI